MQLQGARLEGMSSSTPPGGTEINMALTRIEEAIMFCKMMGWKKVGFAHCIGMIGEAMELSTIQTGSSIIYAPPRLTNSSPPSRTYRL